MLQLFHFFFGLHDWFSREVWSWRQYLQFDIFTLPFRWLRQRNATYNRPLAYSATFILCSFVWFVCLCRECEINVQMIFGEKRLLRCFIYVVFHVIVFPQSEPCSYLEDFKVFFLKTSFHSHLVSQRRKNNGVKRPKVVWTVLQCKMLCQWFVVETGHKLNSLPVTSNIYLQFELPQTFTYNF